jgi:hypothetical protein
MAAGESLDETCSVFMPLHGDGCQLQTSDPALRACVQRGDVFNGKTKPDYLVEKLGCFAGGKTQVGSAQFGELSPGAVTRQGKLGVLACNDDQVHLRRLVFNQKVQGSVHRSRINQVIIIQDENKMLGVKGYFIEHGGKKCFDL